jgi:deoxyguanosine kinase
MKHSYIAVEGSIGAGKTTLAKRLAMDLKGRLVLEEFEDNPFLPRFYEDPDRFAFSVELAFLAQRYHQLKRITEQDLFSTCTIADYSLGKSLIFASVTLPPDEYTLFRDLYGIMFNDLPRPGLIVYLHLSTKRLRERIAMRGRGYEQGIQEEYLVRIHERYMDHLHKTTGQDILVVDIGEADLLHDQGAYDALVQEIIINERAGLRVISV